MIDFRRIRASAGLSNEDIPLLLRHDNSSSLDAEKATKLSSLKIISAPILYPH